MNKEIRLLTWLLIAFLHNAIGQNINIPDINFKNALLANNAINLNLDGEIQLTEATAYSGRITISNSSISDLTGIENFINIVGLKCDSNQITTLDLNSNTSLNNLSCKNNQITNINISNCILLDSIEISNNQINTINLNNNAELLYFKCTGNPIPAIDFTNNPLLNVITIHNTSISNIDLTNNPNLVRLQLTQSALNSIDLSANVLLNQLYLSENNLSTIDLSNLTNLQVLQLGNNNLTNLSLNNNTNLSIIFISDNALTSIDLSALSNLNVFRCVGNNLTTIDFSNNPALEEINVSENNLSTLNLDQNIALSELKCSVNHITKLNLNNNPNLTEILCDSNNIASLNLEFNSLLENLECQNNQLKYLNLKNGSTNYPTINALNNLLSCVEVENVNYASVNYLNFVDPGVGFSGHCNLSIIAESPTTICNGDSVLLVSSDSIGIRWNTNDTTQHLYVNSSGTYYLIDSNGDPVSNQIIVSVKNITLSIPDFQIVNNNLTSAPLLAEIINTSAGILGADYVWSFGDGMLELNNSDTVYHQFSEDGTYNISLMVLEQDSGCFKTNFESASINHIVTCNAGITNNCTFNPTANPAGPIDLCIGQQATLTASGYPIGSILQWFNNGFPIGGETCSLLTVNQSGYYYFTALSLMDSCYQKSNDVYINAVNTSPIIPQVLTQSINSNCDSSSTELYLNNNYTNILWSTGETSDAIQVENGGVYFVTCTTNNGCIVKSNEININHSLQNTPIICMSTIDTILNTHIILWEKELTSGIQSYVIKKESAFNSGIYLPIDTILYDSLSEYNDLNSIASSCNSLNYRIGVIDTCGGQAADSNPTRAIILQTSPAVGVQRFLSWNDYLSELPNNNNYYIYSGQDPLNLVLTDSVAGNVHFWLDPNPVLGVNTIYRIEKKLPIACESTRAVRGRSVSNGTGNLLVITNTSNNLTESEHRNLEINPNPNNGSFTYSVSETLFDGFYSIAIYDLLGHVVFVKQIEKNNVSTVNCILPNGLYILQFRSNKHIYTEKFVIKN